METTQNPSPEAPKSSKNNYVSIDEMIVQMKLTFGNAKLPTIFPVMETVGYSMPRIDALQSKLTVLELLQQTQTKEYADQYAESEKYAAKRSEIDVDFTKHRALAKILFKTNTEARAALKLDRAKPLAYADWYQMAVSFYNLLPANAAMLAKAETIGITAEVLAAQKQALIDLQTLKESQRKETAEAQQATENRDRAYDELLQLHAEYVKYARVLLSDSQALEAIGVRVKGK